MTDPGDPSVLLTAFQGDLARAGIVRSPGVADATRPPMWLEPPDAVAPGDKTGVENDARVVLSAFLQAGPSGGPNDRWHRMHIVEVRIRTQGNGGAQLATATENRIRRHLLGDTVIPTVDFDLEWVSSSGTNRLRVIEARLSTELQRVGAEASTPPKWHHRVEYLFELYADRGAVAV